MSDMGRYTSADEFCQSSYEVPAGAPACDKRDLVSVIRCKNCRYWDNLVSRSNIGICQPPSKSLGGYCVKRGATTAEDYCSFAEPGKRNERFKVGDVK